MTVMSCDGNRCWDGNCPGNARCVDEDDDKEEMEEEGDCSGIRDTS